MVILLVMHYLLLDMLYRLYNYQLAPLYNVMIYGGFMIFVLSQIEILNYGLNVRGKYFLNTLCLLNDEFLLIIDIPGMHLARTCDI